MDENENSLKIVLLGDSGIGKTTIVTKFVTGSIPETNTPTVGAAFTTKDYNYKGTAYRLLIWDTAGQELYRGLAPMYYRSAVIAIVVFDVTKEKTFASCKYWIDELRDKSENDAIIIICGNKCDLERQVDSDECQQFASDNNALYCETSALTGSGLDRLFQLAISEYDEKTKKTDKVKGKSSTVSIEKEEKKESDCC